MRLQNKFREFFSKYFKQHPGEVWISEAKLKRTDTGAPFDPEEKTRPVVIVGWTRGDFVHVIPGSASTESVTYIKVLLRQNYPFLDKPTTTLLCSERQYQLKQDLCYPIGHLSPKDLEEIIRLAELAFSRNK